MVVRLAPCYGSKDLNTLDDTVIKDPPEAPVKVVEVQVMLAMVIDKIHGLHESSRTWDRLVNTFTNCSVLTPEGDPVANTQTQKLEKFGSKDSLSAEVLEFFRTLVGDRTDILDSAGIETKFCARWSPLLDTLKNSKISDRKNLLDITILRFPELSRASTSLELYHMVIDATVQERKRAFFGSSQQVDLIGEFMIRRYKPYTQIIDLLSEGAKANASKYLKQVMTTKPE